MKVPSVAREKICALSQDQRELSLRSESVSEIKISVIELRTIGVKIQLHFVEKLGASHLHPEPPVQFITEGDR